jgi:hypothetical protein
MISMTYFRSGSKAIHVGGDVAFCIFRPSWIWTFILNVIYLIDSNALAAGWRTGCFRFPRRGSTTSFPAHRSSRGGPQSRFKVCALGAQTLWLRRNLFWAARTRTGGGSQQRQNAAEGQEYPSLPAGSFSRMSTMSSIRSEARPILVIRPNPFRMPRG